MNATRALGAVVLLAIALPGTGSAADDVVVAEVTFETCAEGMATVLKGEACHVQDVAKNKSRWELTLKFGVFVEASAAAGAGVGAAGSSAFTVKLTIPGGDAKSADEVRQYVVSHSADVANKIAAALKKKASPAPSGSEILRAIKAQSCSMDDAQLDAWLKKNSCSVDD